MLLGCSDDGATLAPNVSAEQQAVASRMMGLKFPPETRFLFYHRAKEDRDLLPAPDDSLHVKIELRGPALTTFLSQPPLNEATWKSTAVLLGDTGRWKEWKPSGVQKFRSDKFEWPKSKFLHVLIDDDREDTKVVYLFWFET
ncbi:MAG: hypothetical protein QM770_11455 [Tepidisphaeraceae bacterium]